MTPDMVVTVIAMTAWLVLALRGFRAHNVSRARTMAMAAIWLVIIAGLGIVIHYFSG